MKDDAQYRKFFQSIYAVTLLIDSDTGAVKDANPAACAFYGWSLEELKEKRIFEINTMTEEEIRAEMQAARMEERNHFFFKHRLANGEVRDVEVRSGPISLQGEQLLYSVIHDITQLKLAEEGYQNILATTMDGFWLVDMQGRFLDVNDAYCRLIGYSRDELLTMSIQDVEVLETAEETIQRINDIVEQGYQRFESKHRCKNGSVIDVEVSTNYLADQKEFIVFLRNITERKEAEEALWESEKLLRTIAENYPQSYLSIIKSDYTTGFTSGQEFQRQNLDPEQFIGLTLEQIFGDKAPLIRSHYEKAFQGEEQSFELFLNDQYQLYRTVPLYAEDGSIPRILSVVENITERKQAEKRLRESQERLQTSVDHMPNAYILFSPEGQVLEWNRTAERIFGYTKEEMVGQSAVDFIVPEEARPLVVNVFSQLEKGKTASYSEKDNNVHKDGRLMTCQWHNTPLTDRTGEVFAILSMAEDITERQQAEEQIKQQQYYLEKAQELGRIGTWELDLKQNRLFWTDENCRIFGVPTGSVVNYEIFLEKIHPDDREYVDREWSTALEGKPYDIEHQLLIDGEIRWVREKADVEFNEEGVAVKAIGFTQDITEKKQAEATLQEVLLQQQETVRAGNVGLWDWDFTTGKVNYSTEWKHQIGYEEHEITDDFEEWRSRVHPDDLKSALETVELIKTKGLQHHPNEFRFRHKDGSYRWILAQASVKKDETGHPIRMVGSHVDLTEQRQLELKYQTLFDRMLDGFALHEIICDDRGKPVDYRFLDANPAFEQITGLKRKEIVGRTALEILPNIEPYWIETYGRVALSGDPVFFDNYAQEMGKHFEVTSFRPAPHQFACIFADVTERKRMEKELIRTQRLRASGELSAGVSHNLNNILTGVLMSAQFLKLKTDDPEILEDVDNILTAGQRASDLVHRLHLSVRGVEERNFQPVSINEVIQEAVRTSRPRWKDEPESAGISVELERHLANVPAIRGTVSRLHDILTNLIFNAVDAMPDGGTITVATQLVDDYVQFTFRDTGIGMDAETQRRVFEPFFTTKMDVGSGLGLSTVYKTVEQWKGAIDVESALDEGTTFTLRLPVWKEDELDEHQEEVKGQSRSGKVLIIDDDEGICSLLSRFLDKDHDVDTAMDGRKALDQFAPGIYDVAFIDLGMSGLSGNRVAQEMRQKDSLVSTILITGWELSKDDARREPFDLEIKKPFDDLDEIMGVVAQAIALHDERAKKRS
jgi:PAS domain S-box-containing protein